MSAIALEREILRNEILRTEILRTNICVVLFGIFFLFILLYMGLGLIFFPDAFNDVDEQQRRMKISLIIVSCIIAYYLILRYLLQIVLRKSIAVPLLTRCVALFIETSLPTLFLFWATTSYPLMYMLVSPRVFLYFIFIILSALTLNPWLCVFSGVVATVEYTSLYYYFYELYPLAVGGKDPYLVQIFLRDFSSTPIILGSAVILCMAGCSTAFVTQQIKKQLFNVFAITKEREHIANVFGQHVSPEVVTMLLQKGKKLTSEAKKVCILFLDIRGFTTFSEDKNPAEVVDYLNQLFTFMVEIVNANHGIINKFLGDGFMAVFGAPIAGEHDPDNAVHAAEQILLRIDEAVAQGIISQTRVGIGIHYGTSVTGTIGAFQRQEYTIIGDVVNLASRIETLNKTYQSQLLISEDVYQQLQEKKGVLLGDVDVIGRHNPIKLYQLR